MPLPKYIVRLTAEERTELEELTRTGKRAASTILHARILLKADVGDGGPGWDDERIAEAVECGASTVYRVRQAFVEEIHHTPKHGSGLNVAEIELSVLTPAVPGPPHPGPRDPDPGGGRLGTGP